MKLNYYLPMVLVGVAASAQSIRTFDYDVANIIPQIVSPNISLLEEQTAIVGNLDDFAMFANKPIETRTDRFTVGGGVMHKADYSYSNAEMYVGRSGSHNSKFRMSLNFGYYQLRTPELNDEGEIYQRKRQATYAGASFSYHYDEYSYFGVAVKDVYDVAISDGSDATFALYEGMTPTAYTNITFFNDNFNQVSLYADYSYNPEQKSTYSIALKYGSETLQGGAFYSDGWGGYLQYNFDWIYIYAAQTDKTSIGVVFR
ncbi:MAG TPA: hypothetical protein VEA37_08380 [Flavobacterium sp.]|nr:hypothetical protein [Flavobacterium sp.]